MMKRKLFLVLISMFVLVFFCSCTFEDTTQKYINALSKTSSAESMQAKTKLEVQLDLSNASSDTKKLLEKLQNTTVTMDEWVEKKGVKSVTDFFMSGRGIMMNATFYLDGNSIFAQSSFTGDKYLVYRVPEINDGKKNSQSRPFSEFGTLMAQYGDIWRDVAGNEAITSEGNNIKNTPDGDIKVTQLSLELTDPKAKNIIKRFIEVFSQNQPVKEKTVENAIRYYDSAPKDEITRNINEWYRELPGNFEKMKEKFTLEKLKITAKIDKDLFIVEQIIDFAGMVEVAPGDKFKISASISTTRWNINSHLVKVDIPKLTKENIIEDFGDRDMENFKEMWKGFSK